MNFRSAWLTAGLVLVGCGGAFTLESNGDAGLSGGGGKLDGDRDASTNGGGGGDAIGGSSSGASGALAGGAAGAPTTGGHAGTGGAVLTGGTGGALADGAGGTGTVGGAAGLGTGGLRDSGAKSDALAAVDAASDATSPDAAVDFTECSGPGQCIPVLRACCPSCTTPELAGYAGVNQTYADAYRTKSCARTPICPAIACPIGPAASSNPNIGAQCVMGHCQAFDVRRVPEFSACSDNKECTLRAGLGCCECASSAWVGVSYTGRPALAAAVCAPNARCLACAPMPPVDLQPACSNGACVVN